MAIRPDEVGYEVAYSLLMKVFIFGLGYSALHISRALQRAGCEIASTVRSRAKADGLIQTGIAARVFSSDHLDEQIAKDVGSSDAILVSVPPGELGDPVFAAFSGRIAEAPNLRWLGYLSTVGVYGDHAGDWVDERTATKSVKGRSQLRIEAEKDWLAVGAHIFRLSGIYGPGRNQLVQIAEGTARRIIKPGQVFNRIHVADIVAVIEASLAAPRPGAIYNVSDDEPAPPQDVVEFASKLCGLDPPPGIPFEKADLSPMARSFYNENRRVRNTLIREELGATLNYPTYREGLAALRAAGEGPG